jgi:fibronectin-binding autotransporter adhesin
MPSSLRSHSPSLHRWLLGTILLVAGLIPSFAQTFYPPADYTFQAGNSGQIIVGGSGSSKIPTNNSSDYYYFDNYTTSLGIFVGAYEWRSGSGSFTGISVPGEIYVASGVNLQLGWWNHDSNQKQPYAIPIWIGYSGYNWYDRNGVPQSGVANYSSLTLDGAGTVTAVPDNYSTPSAVWVGASSSGNSLTVGRAYYGSTLLTADEIDTSVYKDGNGNNTGYNSIVVTASGTISAHSLYLHGNQDSLTVQSGSTLFVKNTLQIGTTLFAYAWSGTPATSPYGDTMTIDSTSFWYDYGNNSANWIGHDGNNNSITSAGTVSLSGSITIGNGSNTNNSLNITGGSFSCGTVNLQSTQNSINISAGNSYFTTINILGTYNSMNMSGGQSFITTLNIGGGGINNHDSVNVTGGTINATTLDIGSGGSGDTFNASYCTVNATNLYVGDNYGGGVMNTLWATVNVGNLIVGNASGYNTLTASNSAITSQTAILGNGGGGGDTILLTGSTWTNYNSMMVGKVTDHVSLTISNGSTLTTAGMTLGNGSLTSQGNESVVVTGSNSALYSSASVILGGSQAASNSLTVSSGAQAIFSSWLQLGTDPNSLGSGNTVTVTGSTSFLSASNVQVGYNTTQNSINVNSGAYFNDNSSLFLGYWPSSTGNSLVVSNGAFASISSNMFVGYGGGNDSVTVGSSTLTSYATAIGWSSGSNNVTVNGSGSYWTNTATIYVGYTGSSNSLVISDSATVDNGGSLVVGYSANSKNNSLSLQSNSILNVASKLTVGWSGSGNSMLIQGGSQVTSGSGNISLTNSGSNNSVIVDGTGSLWSVSGSLGIGGSGAGTLTVTNGAMVTAASLNVANGSINISSNSVVDIGNANTQSAGGVYLGGGSILGTLGLQANVTISTLNWSTNGRVSLHPGGQVLNVTGNLTVTNGGGVFTLVNPALNNDTSTILTWGTNASGFTTSNFSVYGLTGYTFTTNGNALRIFMPGDAAPVASVDTTMSDAMTLASLTYAAGNSTITQTGALTATSNVIVSGGSLILQGTITTPILSVSNGASFSMIDGTLHGNLNNAAGGYFFMDPSVVNGNVTNAGSMTVVDQNTINGNLQLTGTSTLTYGNAGQLIVSGIASLGGVLDIATPISYGTRILSATRFTGSFTGTIAPAGERLRDVTNGVTLEYFLIAPASYTQVARNRNQSNVATALNSYISSTSGDQLTISTALDNLSASQYSQAFNAIMPTFYQQIATIAFNQANAQNMELNQRLWGVRVAEGGGFSMSGLADNCAVIEEGQGDGKGVLDSKKDILRPGLDNRWGMFVDGNGIFAQANSANMLPGYNSESGGVTAGLTYKWSKSVATGIYSGYQGSYTKSGANGSGLGCGSSLVDNAVRFGVFGTYGQENGRGLYANALAGGAYHNDQATRVIQFPGLNRTANSAPGAGELDTMLATGYDLQKGKFTYGPTASLQYTYLGVNSVHENGAQSLNFNSGGWNSSSMLSSLGGHVAYNWVAGKDVLVTPQISLNWQHEFMQNPYAINGNLEGNSPTFSNWSATGIRDYLYTGVGFTVEFGKRWNTSFFYNAAAGNSDLVSQNIFWSAAVKF